MKPTIAIVVASLFFAGPAWAGKNQISGQVVDRNGQPMPRAVVSLSPGNVSLVTDRDGYFVIDYLREEDGKRTRLDKKVDYTVEVFKAGFHMYAKGVVYRRGALEVETITMVPRTVAIADLPENLDPALYAVPTKSFGVSLMGE